MSCVPWGHQELRMTLRPSTHAAETKASEWLFKKNTQYINVTAEDYIHYGSGWKNLVALQAHSYICSAWKLTFKDLR